jgi:hypothetical protein
LRENGGAPWPARLGEIAHGAAPLERCGPILQIDLEEERKVSATPTRLAWMLKNADKLAPSDGRLWNELRRRVGDRNRVERALATKTIPRDLILEGKTCADCLIECERAFIWIEGKRHDWLASSTKWDVSRDQLARNVEAVWSLAQAAGKEYRVFVCHEYPLKHHERSLLDGYRRGSWSAGWPHIPEEQRCEFSKRIGTLTGPK